MITSGDTVTPGALVTFSIVRPDVFPDTDYDVFWTVRRGDYVGTVLGEFFDIGTGDIGFPLNVHVTVEFVALAPDPAVIQAARVVLQNTMLFARDLLDDTLVSADGSDVLIDRYWATQQATNTFNEFWGIEYDIRTNPYATLVEILEATAQIRGLTAAFEAARQRGTADDQAPELRAELYNLIEEAWDRFWETDSSNDGDDVLYFRYWVSANVLGTFQQAIYAAEAAYNDGSLTLEQMQEALDVLQSTIDDFVDTRQRGLWEDDAEIRAVRDRLRALANHAQLNLIDFNRDNGLVSFTANTVPAGLNFWYEAHIYDLQIVVWNTWSQAISTALVVSILEDWYFSLNDAIETFLSAGENNIGTYGLVPEGELYDPGNVPANIVRVVVIAFIDIAQAVINALNAAILGGIPDYTNVAAEITLEGTGTLTQVQVRTVIIEIVSTATDANVRDVRLISTNPVIGAWVYFYGQDLPALYAISFAGGLSVQGPAQGPGGQAPGPGQVQPPTQPGVSGVTGRTGGSRRPSRPRVAREARPANIGQAAQAPAAPQQPAQQAPTFTIHADLQPISPPPWASADISGIPIGLIDTTIPAEGVENGTFTISISGLPSGIYAPDFVDVLNGQFDFTLLITNLAMAGVYNITITLYCEEGTEVFTSAPFTFIIQPAELVPTPIEQPQPLPGQLPPVQLTQPVNLRLVIDNATHTVNGVPVLGEVAPFIDPAYGRTMVPLRVIAEALGAEVNWIDATRTVTIAANGQFLTLQIGQPLPGGMGTAMIVNDRTFVPIAYIAETLGANVRWDADNRAVYVQR
jgi:hypothetical protein